MVMWEGKKDGGMVDVLIFSSFQSSVVQLEPAMKQPEYFKVQETFDC